MDIEKTIKQEVEKEVMQAINDLGVKSVMREKVLEAEISKDDVIKMISDSVDSYVRSVDIERIVRHQLERMVKEGIQKNIKEMFDMSSYDYRPNSVFRSEMEKQVRQAFNDNFKLSINVERITE